MDRGVPGGSPADSSRLLPPDTIPGQEPDYGRLDGSRRTLVAFHRFTGRQQEDAPRQMSERHRRPDRRGGCLARRRLGGRAAIAGVAGLRLRRDGAGPSGLRFDQFHDSKTKSTGYVLIRGASFPTRDHRGLIPGLKRAGSPKGALRREATERGLAKAAASLAGGVFRPAPRAPAP